MSVGPLFTSGNLWNQLTAQEQEALEAVKDIAPDVVLATPEVDLVGQLYDKFWIEPLQLHPEQRYSPTGVAATKFEVRAGPFRDVYEGGPTHVDGTRFELAVPFDGADVLFDLRPSQFTMQFPRAEVRGADVVIVYEGLNPADAEAIKSQLDGQLDLLGRYVEWSAVDCRAYNERLKPGLAQAVAKQRQKILAERAIEAALDIPVRRRADPSPVLNVAVPRVGAR